ncbi:MAG TPA: RDD family protein [Chthonomonadaceae bacterium]|nr:RDD family protein [Chthonomonadaceae bacterium]
MSTERDAGVQALQQGNPAAAAPLLETACQQNPNDFDALLFLGAAYGQIGRQMDAINTITRAVQVQPSNAQARYNLAVAMEQGGYKEQALTACDQALTLQPDYPKAQELKRRLQGDASGGSATTNLSAQQPPAAPAYGQQPGGGAPPANNQGFGAPLGNNQGFGAPPPADASGSQGGFGRVPETPAQPPSYGGAPGYGGFTPPAQGGQAGGPPPYGQQPGQAGAAPTYGQQQAPVYGQQGAAGQPNPYAPQQPPTYGGQPPATPYGQQPPQNPYAQPQGLGQYGGQQQGPYPYSPRTNVNASVLGQTVALEYASFGQRLGAMLLDGIILFIPLTVMNAVIIGIAAAGASGGGGSSSDAIAGAQGICYLINTVAQWLYFAGFESSVKQATPGKMALNIMVTDLDGNRIGFGRATGRYFGKIVSSIILLIGYFMAAFTEKKQALHDMMAGTLVVRR